MGDFRRDNRSGGGRDFKRRDFGSRDDRPQVMHETICSDCGKECEVPFKPTGSKPVFCRDCFQSKRSGEKSENFRRPDFQDRNSNPTPRTVEQPQYREQFEALNAKLDKILNLLTPKDLRVKEVEISELDQIPQIEIPIIKKKRVSKK